jgi:hypothetical protein
MVTRMHGPGASVAQWQSMPREGAGSGFESRSKSLGAASSAVERGTFNPTAQGSIPWRPTRGMEKLGRSRRPHKPEIEGSNPSSPTNGSVAQRVARRSHKAEAAGSSPAAAT